MKFICRIDLSLYRCISEDITTDVVLVTEERIAHSNRHQRAFDRYGSFLRAALTAPDYIIEDKRPNTGLVVKKVEAEDGRSLLIVLRVHVSGDPAGYKNSIISCWDIGEARLKNYLRNRKILYKSHDS
ncbi:MAG: hypothetical protein IKS52_04510 [Clostridia bacterium]|nr:hypothetical protein [Clostridia bacterium]MBR4727054.1 hypothetical protein [Clostridia bacterium]